MMMVVMSALRLQWRARSPWRVQRSSHMEKGLQRPAIDGPAAGQIDACATKAPSGFFHVSACVQPALEAAEIAHVAVTHILQCLADER
jgi:hypothetical protein